MRVICAGTGPVERKIYPDAHNRTRRPGSLWRETSAGRSGNSDREPVGRVERGADGAVRPAEMFRRTDHQLRLRPIGLALRARRVSLTAVAPPSAARRGMIQVTILPMRSYSRLLVITTL